MLDSAHVIVNNGEGDLEAYTRVKATAAISWLQWLNAGKFIALAITIRFSFHY